MDEHRRGEVSASLGRILDRYGIGHSRRWLEDSSYVERERWRALAREDLYFLSTVILGNSRFSTIPMQGPLGESGLSHSEEMCRLLNSDWGGKSRLLMLLPRKHFKTTTLQAYVIQQILRRPSVTVLVVGATLKHQAKPFVQAVKSHLESNPVLRGLFPEIRPVKGQWGADSITVQRPGQISEPTVKATGLDSQVERWHGDLIIKDDIVTFENSKTRERQLNVIAWAKSLSPMLNEWGREIVAGTRYADYDYYSILMREEAELWETLVRSAAYDADGYPTLELENAFFLFPEEWNAVRLREQLIELGPEAFSCQFLNEPVPRQLQEVKPDWVESAFVDFPEDLEATNYVGMDPATGSGADRSAVAVVAIDEEGNFWVRELQSGKWNTSENVRKLLDILETYEPAHTLFEAIGVGAGMQQLILEGMTERGLYRSVEFVKHWDKNLTELARSVVLPRLEAGRIRLAAHLRQAPIVEQLLRFPRARSDDDLAALTMAIYAAAQWGHGVYKVEEPAQQEISDPYSIFPVVGSACIHEWIEAD